MSAILKQISNNMMTTPHLASFRLVDVLYLVVFNCCFNLSASALAMELDLLPNAHNEDDLNEWLADGYLDQASYHRLLAELAQPSSAASKSELTNLAGQVRYRSHWLYGDFRVPAQALELEGAWRQINSGLALLIAREQIGQAAYDPIRQALTAPPAQPRLLAPEYYLVWQGERLTAIAGTYRLGFGQRLTFDNSGKTNPQGLDPGLQLTRNSAASLLCRESAGELTASPCAGQAGNRYGAPDFDHSQPLRGVASSILWPLNISSELSTTVFVSLQSRDAYQYTLFNSDVCADPRGVHRQCAAPRVYVSRQPTTAPAAAHAYQTLPALWNETLVGSRLGLTVSQRGNVGITGWGANKQFRPQGIALDHQEWDRYPQGQAYGAIGLDAQVNWGQSLLAGELTRSFDQIPGGGGGWANYSAWTWRQKRQHLQLAARYYSTHFANPYARPYAAADEFEGNRARDEVGLTTNYYRRLGPWQSTVSLDPWLRLTSKRVNLKTYWQQSYRILRHFETGLGLGFEDRDLGYPSGGDCSAVISDADPLPCGGQRWQIQPGLTTQPWPQADLSLRYRHDWQQIDVHQLQQNQLAVLRLTQRWREVWRLALSLRYFDNALDNDKRSERWLTQRVALGCNVNDYLSLASDYLLRLWLDQRVSTLSRLPNPEHWLMLDIRAQF